MSLRSPFARPKTGVRSPFVRGFARPSFGIRSASLSLPLYPCAFEAAPKAADAPSQERLP